MNLNKVFTTFKFILLCCLLSTSLMGQQTLNLVPPSPTAYGMIKYVDVPVSTYTGVPEISIPILNQIMNDLKLDISLSYHSSGIKVDEYASTLGMGWNLNAGGVISRNIRGSDDFAYPSTNEVVLREKYTGNMIPAPSSNDEPILYDNCNSVDGVNNETILLDIKSGDLDAEPDLFFFNFLGYSGKFILGKDNNFYLIPQQKMKIIPPHVLNENKWIIITDDGTKYTFGGNNAIEHTSSFSRTYIQNDGGSSDYQTKTDGFVSSWYLNEIESPKGNKIIFKYLTSNPVIEYHESSSFDRYDPTTTGVVAPCDASPKCLGYTISTITKTSMSPIYLDSIVFPLGFCKINYNSNRCDLPGYKRVESLKIFNYNQNLVKDFRFKYSYQNLSNYTGEDIDPGINCTDPNNTRLWLVSAEQVGGGEILKYEFGYNAGSLPKQGSFSQDYWGFANSFTGYSSDNTDYRNFIPSVVGPNGLSLSGANREPDEVKITNGLLNKIIYPTGGKTNFEYEIHQSYEGKKETFSQETILDLKTCYDTQPNACDNFPIETSGTFTISSENPSRVYLFSNIFGKGIISLTGPMVPFTIMIIGMILQQFKGQCQNMLMHLVFIVLQLHHIVLKSQM